MPKNRLCKFDGCNEAHYGLGYCYTHYKQYKNSGTVHKISRRTNKSCKVVNCYNRHFKHGYCQKHWQAKYSKDQINERKRIGVCIDCGGVLDTDKKSCSTCVAEKKERNAKLCEYRAENNLCIVCGKSALETTIGVGVKGNNKTRPLCKEHFFKRLASNITGKTSDAKMLKDILIAQNYKCAYTGQKLILGKNASVDHVIPKSRGGTNDKENLRWVLWEINMMKYNSTFNEFLATCKSIMARTGDK